MLNDKNKELLEKIEKSLYYIQNTRDTGSISFTIHVSQGTGCKLIKKIEQDITK